MKDIRTQAIANYINTHNYASFNELCTEFNVSSATMRRDLMELEDDGLIIRVHGGAKSIAKFDEIDNSLQKRKHISVEEKIKMANYAVTLINNGDSIFLDSSTTIIELAEAIARSDLKITVFTTSVEICSILTECENVELYMLGGYVKRSYGSTFGPFTEKMLKEISFNKFFFSADAIDLERGVLNTHYETIPLKQIALSKSKYKILLLDHTKFGNTSFLKVCDIDDLDQIITDSGLADELYWEFKQYKENIIRV